MKLKLKIAEFSNSMVGDGALINQLLNNKNAFVKLTMKIWEKTITHSNIRESVKLLRWCTYDSDFAPQEQDEQFKT